MEQKNKPAANPESGGSMPTNVAETAPFQVVKTESDVSFLANAVETVPFGEVVPYSDLTQLASTCVWSDRDELYNISEKQIGDKGVPILTDTLKNTSLA
ncbi:hypothetical protein BC938DRAFT_479404, partial [Jimgerdemannia flammicorona]